MEQIIAHPCYSETAHSTIRRKHFPIAPRCNIKCNYCEKGIEQHYHISRPGLTQKIISPQEAFLEVKKDSMEGIKYIVGVAGPGDPLYNQETFQFFEMVYKNFPDIKLCTCTNGLLLPDKITDFISVGVKTITITVNALNPQILEKIVSYAIYNNKMYYGLDAASILIQNQIAGIKMATQNGMIVKVNTVLIPNINDLEIEKIAKFCSEIGVHIMNIVGLIPAGNFKNLSAPSCDELREAREDAEIHIKQFRKCMQCRADADGIIGLVNFL